MIVEIFYYLKNKFHTKLRIRIFYVICSMSMILDWIRIFCFSTDLCDVSSIPTTILSKTNINCMVTYNYPLSTHHWISNLPHYFPNHHNHSTYPSNVSFTKSFPKKRHINILSDRPLEPTQLFQITDTPRLTNHNEKQ